MSVGLVGWGALAGVLVAIAAVVAAAETALTRISRARAEGFAAAGRAGAESLIRVLDDRETSLAGAPTRTSFQPSPF